MRFFKFLVEVYKNVLVGLAVVLVALVATVCVSLTGFMLGVIYEENVKLALLIGFGFLFGLGYCIRKWGWK